MLKYEGKTPVGLDWASIRPAGDPDADWHGAIVRPLEPKPAEEVRRATTNPNHALRTPQAVEREIVRLYVEESQSGVYVAQQVGVQPQTVYKVLRRLGVPVRGKSASLKLRAARERS